MTNKVTVKGEINLNRLAKILGLLKSKEVGYPVVAKIYDKKEGVKQC